MANSIICVINQKGGSGKSSGCFHLAGALSQMGKKVLIVDADPQASITQVFIGSTPTEQLTTQETLAAAYDERTFLSNPEALIQETPFPNIHFIPSNQSLTPHNSTAPEMTGMKQFTLHSFLERLPAFDIVFIDCPPNLYFCTWSALLAARFVMIPVPPEDFGAQGLRAVHQAVDQAQQLNPNLSLLGHVVSRIDGRLLIHQAYARKLRSLYPGTVFKSMVNEFTAFKNAISKRQPINFYDPESDAAKLTIELGCEILDSIADAYQPRAVRKEWPVQEKHLKVSNTI